LRKALGLSFKYLGDLDRATKQFETARALYTAHRGADDPNTLECANNLANSYAALGRHDEALKLRREVFERRQNASDPNDLGVLESKNDLAISLDAAGKYDEALKLREEALERTREIVGPDDVATLRCMNNLAISYATVGRHSAAMLFREEALTAVKDKFGPENPETFPYRNNLASSYHALGRNCDALKLFEETFALAKAKLTDEHPGTLLVMNNLAWFLATCDDARFRDPARAVELASKVANKPPASATYFGTLGAARYRAGDWKRAAQDLETAISLRQPDDFMNANESFFLAMARWRLGDTGGAKDAFDKGVGWMEKSTLRKDEVRRFHAEAAELLGIKDEVKLSAQSRSK